MMKYISFIIILSVLYIVFTSSYEMMKAMDADPKELYQLIDNADMLVVKDSPRKEAKILYESSNRNDLEALKSSLIIKKPEKEFFCACLGTPAIYLYKNEEEIGIITNHHGVSIRFSLWSGNVPVIDREKWLVWFDQRNIPGPRKEVEDVKVRAVKRKKDSDQWMSAMPEAIKPFWADSLGTFGVKDIEPLSQAFKAGIPEKNQQILALLKWFGSGAGPWSGYPGYESAAEELLFEYETEEIISAIESTKLTKEQTEGAARFFGGWDFHKKRPNGRSKLSDELKNTFWDHVKTTTDKDKLGRAENAFKK